jgi:hypothetical protein
MLKFTSYIKIIGVNPYVLVSASRAAKLKKGWKKPMPVIVQVNGKPKEGWKINMMPTGKGSFYLYLSGVVRKASGTKTGDKVEIDLQFDSSYKSGPAHALPAQFKKALGKNANARKAWAQLTPSRQKEILRYFASLKSKEALERNIHKALNVLKGNRERFMARSWDKGK